MQNNENPFSKEFHKEEAFNELNRKARLLLKQVDQFDRTTNDVLVPLDLNHRAIEQDVYSYAQQSGTLRKLINEKALFGMTHSKVSQLVQDLEKTGNHLDSAIEALRLVILSEYPSGGFDKVNVEN